MNTKLDLCQNVLSTLDPVFLRPDSYSILITFNFSEICLGHTSKLQKKGCIVLELKGIKICVNISSATLDAGSTKYIK